MPSNVLEREHHHDQAFYWRISKHSQQRLAQTSYDLKDSCFEGVGVELL